MSSLYALICLIWFKKLLCSSYIPSYALYGSVFLYVFIAYYGSNNSKVFLHNHLYWIIIIVAEESPSILISFNTYCPGDKSLKSICITFCGFNFLVLTRLP